MAVERCACHQRHSPTPTYLELHHVVPQAWQAHWQPATPPADATPGPGTLGRQLWDARTVPLCRTGHGNVHWWLVRAMHAWTVDLTVDQAFDKAGAGRKPERQIAWLAMNRWLQAGGSLADLQATGLYGEI